MLKEQLDKRAGFRVKTGMSAKPGLGPRYFNELAPEQIYRAPHLSPGLTNISLEFHNGTLREKVP